jgi:hypothetical protein
MSAENEELLSAFEHFIEAIDDVVDDWQIGVVTGQSTCFNYGIITPSTPDYAALFTDALREPPGPLTESLLDLANEALAATATCNAGFLRPDRPLQIIAVSDEPEQSDDGWQTLVDEMDDYLAHPTLLHISGLVDVNGTCGEGADGYIDAANATEGVLVDLCGTDLDTRILDLLEPAQQGVDYFTLSQVAHAESIEVWLDTLPVLTGWSYDAARLAVIFDEAPAPGQVVDVRYRPSGCP